MFLGAVLLFRLGKLLYCVSATEGYFYVCMFEEICYFPDFRAVISEGGPFSVFFFSCNGLCFLLHLCFQFSYELWGEFVVVGYC